MRPFTCTLKPTDGKMQSSEATVASHVLAVEQARSSFDQNHGNQEEKRKKKDLPLMHGNHNALWR